MARFKVAVSRQVISTTFVEVDAADKFQAMQTVFHLLYPDEGRDEQDDWPWEIVSVLSDIEGVTEVQ